MEPEEGALPQGGGQGWARHETLPLEFTGHRGQGPWDRIRRAREQGPWREGQ